MKMNKKNKLLKVLLVLLLLGLYGFIIPFPEAFLGYKFAKNPELISSFNKKETSRVLTDQEMMKIIVD